MVFNELIGSFSKEEIELFSPWIDREKVGLVTEKNGPVAYQSSDQLEVEYERFIRGGKANQELLKKYERLFGASYRQMKVAMYLATKRQDKPKGKKGAPSAVDEEEAELMRELIGADSPVDPRGNAKYIESIYRCMEREFETKKRFCKFYFRNNILAERDWMAKNTQEKP